MNKLDTTWTLEAAPADRSAVLDVLAVAGAVMLGAWVRIPLPFSPVPITLQTLPVLLAGYAVGRTRATAGMALYLLLGFAPYALLGIEKSPLLATPFGPTLGYLVAFVFAPTVIARFRQPEVGLLAATLLIYALGAGWLAVYAQCGLAAAVAIGVLPFLAGDLLKVLAARRLLTWI